MIQLPDKPIAVSEDGGVFCSNEISIVAASSATFIAVLGTIGNVTTLLALGGHQPVRNRRRQPTTAFVLSLATADLLFCIFCMPIMALRYGRRQWPFLASAASESFWCRLFPVVLYGTVATSVLSLVALTVNRYILIVHPGWYSAVYRRSGMLSLQLAICWAIPYGLMALPLFEIWGRLGYDRRTFSCTVLPSIVSANFFTNHFSASPKKFIFLVGFALPFCAIVLCYTAIIDTVRRQRRNLQQHAVKQIVASASPSSITTTSSDDEERHLTRTCAAIFGCFLLCFLPLTIANVLLEDKDSGRAGGDIHVLASILTWHSAVLNPFIYALGSRQYRNAYWSVLRCKHCRNSEEDHRITLRSHRATMSPSVTKAKFRIPISDNAGSISQTNSEV